MKNSVAYLGSLDSEFTRQNFLDSDLKHKVIDIYSIFSDQELIERCSRKSRKHTPKSHQDKPAEIVLDESAERPAVQNWNRQRFLSGKLQLLQLNVWQEIFLVM